MIDVLFLTNGTVNVSLIDGTNFALAEGGWSPGITRIRRGELGGIGPYEQVEESFEIDVLSNPASLTTTLTNIANIQYLLDQAQRWARGEGVAVVTLQCQLSGGSRKYATVFDGFLELPSNFADLLTAQEVERVTLNLTRLGTWLSTSGATSSTAGNPGVIASPAFIAATTYASPTSLSVTYNGSHATGEHLINSQVHLANANNIGVIDAESLVTVFPSSSSADTANRASGGAVLRLTQNASLSTTAASTSFTTAQTAAFKTVDIWVTMRVNGAGTLTTDPFSSFSYLVLLDAASGVINAPLSGLRYPSSTLPINPAIIYVGRFSVPNGLQRVYIQYTVQTPATSVDIDQIIVQSVNPQSYVVSVRAGSGAILSSGGSGNNVLLIDPRPLTEPSGTVTMSFSTLVFRPAYAGDVWMTTSAQTLNALVLAPSGSAWRPGTGTTAYNYSFVATRWPVNLSPQ